MELKTVHSTSAPTPSFFKKLSDWATERMRWSFGSILVFLIIWELVAGLKLIDPKYISQPTRVMVSGYTRLSSPDFYHHTYVSLQELVIGFLLAVCSGVIIGLIMGRYRIIAGLFDPLIMALYATPRVALIPLFVIWFGIGMGSKIFVVFIGAVFPVLVNTMTGIRQVDPLLLRAARSFGATERQLFTKVLIPGALPAMMTGIRLAWGRGIIGMVIGEMYISMAGLGHLISKAGNTMQTDELFFLILIVGFIGYLGTDLFRLLERQLSPWREDQL